MLTYLHKFNKMSASTNFQVTLAAIVSEKSTVFTFSNGKAQVTKFDLVIK